MSGPLKNHKWELFVQAMFEGQDVNAAYLTAGYVEDRANAHRLAGRPQVIERLRELQAEAARNSQVTVASLLQELEDARAKASDLSQMSAAINAVKVKAQVSGLLVQRMEVGGPGDFDGLTDLHDIAAKLAESCLNDIGNGPYLNITREDRQELANIAHEGINSLLTNIDTFIAAIRARPIHFSYQAKALGTVGNGKDQH